MKYIIYCRKSSEAEDRQVLSIEAQLNELLRLAERDHLLIDKIYKESMSAKQPGRPIFEKMIKFIEKNQDYALLVWKLDRLARNAFDGGKLSWFMDRGLIKEIRTPEKLFTNVSDDKFMMTLDFGIAKKYVDDLSVNVKRGNRAKLEKGGWPGPAPFGYINNKADKTISVDPERSPYIAKAFALYATGGYSLKQIANILFDEGLRTKAGKKVNKSVLHEVLSSPFYYGIMAKQGKFYQGRHEPLIGKELFDRTQEVLSGKNRGRMQRHSFPARGFMTCDVCGCLLTATQKKGHVYYYCTNGKGNCEEHKQYMRSEVANDFIAGIFGRMDLGKETEMLELAYEAAKEKTQINDVYLERSKENLAKQLDLVRQKKEKLLDGYLAELVAKEVYEAKISDLNNEQILLEAELKKLNNKTCQGVATLEQAKQFILEASLAKKEFEGADDFKKRKLLEKILWNLSFANQEVASFKLKMPYQLLVEAPLERDFSMMLRLLDEVGVYLLNSIK